PPPGRSGTATPGAGPLTPTFALPGAPGGCVPLGPDIQCPLTVSAGSLDIPATCDSPQSCALTLKDTSGLAGVTGTMVLTTAGVPKSVAFNFTDLALTLKLDGSSLTCKSSGSGSGCLGNDECVVTTLDLVANTTCTDDGTTVSIANPTPLQVTGTTALDVSTFTGTFRGTATAGQTLGGTNDP